MKKKKSNFGFTLVELMVVVIIIGILVAIAVPVYNNSQEKARSAACLANQKTINEASYQWHLKHGTYPSDVQELFDNGFLQTVPKCSGNEFSIINSNGNTECPKASDKHVLP